MPKIWLWLNFLSLDAPLVALVWQDFVARQYRIPLFPAGRTVLGLTVWAIYIADRLLDVRAPATGTEPLHHVFYRENRFLWMMILAGVVFADSFCVIFWLRPAVFLPGFCLAVASFAYLACFTGKNMLWKKLFAAILFSSGVFLVAAVNTADLITLAWPWAEFTALCAYNLVLIELWKRQQDARGSAVFVCGVFLSRGQFHWAVSLSFLLLAAIAIWGGKVAVETRRVLADFALFSPLLFR